MTGHIRRRGQRSFELKFDIGTNSGTGKRVTRYHNFKGTRREAELELARLVSAAARGDYVDPSKVTVAEFLDRWERDWAASNVSTKTLERYSELLKNHVRSHIGEAQIQKVRPVNLNELYARLLRAGRGDRGLAARTVGHVHRVLHRAFGHAAQWGVIQQNVATLVRPPPVAAIEIEILAPDQVQTVLRGLRGRSIYPIVRLGFATGMRRGELLALRRKDLDLDTAKLRVEQSLEQTRQGLRFKPPKTRHGRRTISLPTSIVVELREHLRAHQTLRMKLGLGRAPDDALVFPRWNQSTAQFEARSPHWLTQKWALAIAKLPIPKVTLHSLRHTHASQLIASSLDVLTISRRLGHSSPTVTLNVYGHLFPSGDDRAAQIVEAAFASSEAKSRA